MDIYKSKPVVVFATTLLLSTVASSASLARVHNSNHQRASLQGRITEEIAQADALMKSNKFDQAEAIYHDALNQDKNDVAARTGMAMAFAKGFKNDRADEEFDKVLKLDPQNPIAHCGKAMTILNRLQASSTTVSKNRANMLAQAEAECNQALQLDPKSPEANYTSGMVMKEQGNLDRAEELFNAAIASDKNFSDAYVGLGMAKLSKNDFSGAVSNFDQAISVNSGSSTAHYGLGRAYLNQGQVDLAIKELNTSLYQFRNSAPVHFELGKAYEQQGNTIAAIQHFQEAIRIKSENPAPFIHIADIRENRGDIEHAIAELRSGLELMPNNPELMLRVANADLRLEKIDDSIRDYQKVLNTNPRSTVAADGLTRAFYLKAQKESTGAFFESNDYEQAEKAIEKAVAMNPNNMELRLAQAKLYALSGRTIALNTVGTPSTDGERVAYAEALLAQNKFQESTEQMNMLINSAGASKQVLALGDLGLMIKDLDSAEAAYKKAAQAPDGAERAQRGLEKVAKARESARVDLTMADDLLRKKQFASAVDKYHEAVFANPKNPGAREGLALALERLYPDNAKELREATVQYRVFMALQPSIPEKDQEKLQKHIAKIEIKANRLERETASASHKTIAERLNPRHYSVAAPIVR